MSNLRTPILFRLLAVCLAAPAAVVAPAAAQTAGAGKWEIEFHSGGMSPTNPTTGSVSLPGPGEAFTTAGIYPPPAPPSIAVATSRRESSWYFGDGATLFNQGRHSRGGQPVGDDRRLHRADGLP
jgi:hypothetical protein